MAYKDASKAPPSLKSLGLVVGVHYLIVDGRVS
jgi:hypothetical protein